MTFCHNTQNYIIFACLLTAKIKMISVSAVYEYGENDRRKQTR